MSVTQSDYMCPNCQTPWKCNGPHEPDPDYDTGHDLLIAHAPTDLAALLRVADAVVRQRAAIEESARLEELFMDSPDDTDEDRERRVAAYQEVTASHHALAAALRALDDTP